MKYTIRYFKDSLPDWKKKRDPIMVRFLYRPVSFVFSSIFSNLGFTANDVSNISTVIGILACVMIFIPNYVCGIIGAVLLNLWIIFDCTDGNIARTIKKLPYGEYVDAVSCYVLIALLFNSLGYRSYCFSGMIFQGKPIIILLGGLASVFDNLMRLIYQRYVVSSDELGINERLEHDPDKTSKLNRWRIRIDLNMSIGGFLPFIILIAMIFNFTDIVVVIWALYNFFFCFASSIYLVHKATKYGNQHSD